MPVMSKPESQPDQLVADEVATKVAADTGLIERPKGPVRVLFEVELGSEIQMARFVEVFARGLMEVGVQGADIRKVATADRVTSGPDGERVLERIPQIGPKQ